MTGSVMRPRGRSGLSRREAGLRQTGSSRIALPRAFCSPAASWVLLLNAPSFKLLLPWPGPPRFVSMGVYLFIGASPLAFFALVYWLGGWREGLQFNDKLNRFHFWVAIIALIDSVRLAGTWVMSQVSTQAASYLRSDTLEVGGLLLLALGICITNIVVSRRTSGSTLTVGSRTR